MLGHQTVVAFGIVITCNEFKTRFPDFLKYEPIHMLSTPNVIYPQIKNRYAFQDKHNIAIYHDMCDDSDEDSGDDHDVDRDMESREIFICSRDRLEGYHGNSIIDETTIGNPEKSSALTKFVQEYFPTKEIKLRLVRYYGY